MPDDDLVCFQMRLSRRATDELDLIADVDRTNRTDVIRAAIAAYLADHRTDEAFQSRVRAHLIREQERVRTLNKWLRDKR